MYAIVAIVNNVILNYEMMVWIAIMCQTCVNGTVYYSKNVVSYCVELQPPSPYTNIINITIYHSEGRLPRKDLFYLYCEMNI